MNDTIVNFTDASRTEAATAQLFRHPVNVKRFDGYCSGANTFLQIHNTKTAPATNDIPLKSLQLFGNDGFSFVFTGRDEIKCTTGLFIGLSSDETKYVAEASGTKISGDMEVDDFEAYPGFTKTVVGDYTTGVALLQVWNDPTNTNNLQRIEVTNGNAAAVIFCVIARNASTVGAKVLWSSPSVAAAASATYNFGPNGLQCYEKTSAGVEWQGCRIVAVLASTLSSTNTLASGLPAVIATTDFNIRATYKS